MWISDHWKDYELLDCGGGERLERWGKYLLVRPDPQAIWRPEGTHPGWQRCDGAISAPPRAADSGAKRTCLSVGVWIMVPSSSTSNL